MKVRADRVKAALAAKHADDFFLTEVKNGPTQSVANHFKLDALAFKKSWANPAIIGYEIKVDRSDFMRDNKWPAYLSLCNQFSFVCPVGLISPEELPSEVGLIYYNPEKDTLYTKRKALYRLIDEPVNMYKYIIMSRLDSDRYPFFSTARDYFAALQEDKVDRKHLGIYVAKAAGEHINGLNNRIKDLESQIARHERDRLFEEDVRSVLRECEIPTNYGWRDRLKSRLNVGLSEEMKIELWKVKQALERMEGMLATPKSNIEGSN